MSTLPALDIRKHRERALHTRLMVAHETALEHHLKRVIVDLGRSAARMHRDHGKEGLAQVMAQAPGRIRQVLRPSLLTTATEFAHRLQQKSAGIVLETKAFETLDSAMRDWVDIHVGTRITQIGDSVQVAIQEVIRRGIEEGWSEAEIASAIEDATGGEIAGWRARRIARTETHTAANAGQYIAAQSSPLDYTKEWLATEDDRYYQHGAVDLTGLARAVLRAPAACAGDDDASMHLVFASSGIWKIASYTVAVGRHGRGRRGEDAAREPRSRGPRRRRLRVGLRADAAEQDARPGHPGVDGGEPGGGPRPLPFGPPATRRDAALSRCDSNGTRSPFTRQPRR